MQRLTEMKATPAAHNFQVLTPTFIYTRDVHCKTKNAFKIKHGSVFKCDCLFSLLIIRAQFSFFLFREFNTTVILL